MFVDQALAARLEAAQAWRGVHFAEAYAAITRATNSGMILVGEAPVVNGGAGAPVNRAMGLGMQGPVSATDLDAVEEFYTQSGQPTTIDLCPLAHPSLHALLQDRGYRMHDWKSMLALPLPAPPVRHAPNPAITVTRATPDQQALWATTSCHGFSGRPTDDPHLYNILAANFAAAHAQVYFAWLDGISIATGGMYPHAGVAELGGASTLPDYRRLGAQTALIHQRLTDAYALGCDHAAVLTTPGSDSQRNLQARGFQLAYTRAILVRPLPRP